MNIFINGIDLTEPGKRILLFPDSEIQNSDAFEIKKILEEEFPGIKFSILTGFASHVVVPDSPSYDIEVEDE